LKASHRFHSDSFCIYQTLPLANEIQYKSILFTLNTAISLNIIQQKNNAVLC